MKRIGLISLVLLAVMFCFQNCENKSGDPIYQGQENGTGYSGLRPEAGVYTARITCATNGSEGFEKLTVKDDSDKALVENECTQQSKEVKVAELDFKPYRKELLTHDEKIYEKDLPRDPEYYNEALCDFSDKSLGVLIRWYDVHLFHVRHIFTMNGMTAGPVLRFSDIILDDGYLATGYMGEDFQLAIINNFKIGEGFAGIFNGKVDGQDIVEAFGYCVTTIYTCNPIQLELISTGENSYDIQTIGTSDANVSGTLAFNPELNNGELGDLNLAVQLQDGNIFDCRGYVNKLNNELSVGGCKNRPTDGSEPKQVMIQVRGTIQWASPDQGTVTSKVCIGDSILEDPQ